MFVFCNEVGMAESYACSGDLGTTESNLIYTSNFLFKLL